MPFPAFFLVHVGAIVCLFVCHASTTAEPSGCRFAHLTQTFHLFFFVLLSFFFQNKLFILSTNICFWRKKNMSAAKKFYSKKAMFVVRCALQAMRK